MILDFEYTELDELTDPCRSRQQTGESSGAAISSAAVTSQLVNGAVDKEGAECSLLCGSIYINDGDCR